MHARRAAACVAGMLLAGTFTACFPVEQVVPLPEGVSIELVQLRSDVADRTAQVRIHNESGDDVQVRSLVVDDARFDGPATRERDSLIAAGRTVDLRIELPPVQCVGASGQAVEGSGEARATLDFEIGGRSFVSDAVLVDPLGFVPRLHDRECLREELAAVVSLEWGGFEPSEAGAPATITLAVTPAGFGGTALLAGIHTTNLLKFTLEDADALQLDELVSAVDVESSIEVPLVPWRCDPHAVMEDKRGTVFTIDVEVAGRSGPIEVAAPEDMRGDILLWVAQWCGFGPGGAISPFLGRGKGDITPLGASGALPAASPPAR